MGYIGVRCNLDFFLFFSFLSTGKKGVTQQNIMLCRMFYFNVFNLKLCLFLCFSSAGLQLLYGVEPVSV